MVVVSKIENATPPTKTIQSLDLANVVDDLLVAAKTQAGTLVVVRVPVNLLAQSAQILETIDPGKHGDIELTGPSVRAMGDPGRVRQILRNLISNALRYGGDTVRISTLDTDSAARVLVSDDGPAIPQEERERIFEPYQRAHHNPGLTASIGLGLPISRQLAQLMDGDLNYRYEKGENVFELTLPKAE